MLWPDTFTNHFDPHIGEAAARVLADAGWRVVLPGAPVCCGLTWISTGQLATAERVARRTLRTLRPRLETGTPIVGLEPSCTAALRDDLPDLVGGDDARRLSAQTVTFAELLRGHRSEGWVGDATPWDPPRAGGRALVQRHCHHVAALGFDADRELMEAAGVEAEVLDSGCCGLAGNFGFEVGHHDVSLAIGERVLLPAVRRADPGTTVLADGFSCRTQIADATDRRGHHVAELLATALPDRP